MEVLTGVAWAQTAQFTGEELQVKFLADSEQNSLSN
jgi:hypothetical protein